MKRNNSGRRERLDAVGRAVLHASAANEAEAEEVAAAPFLYARVRARIAAERERRAEGEHWLAVLGVAWRAVPAMALVCALALALLLTSSSGSPGVPAQGGLVEEALAGGTAGGTAAGYERVLFADRAALSGDEVLRTILEDGPEAQR
ncbi:MAG TPA: hypothetical protein VEY09_18010 [Pyrinomonadaceae bacterium]|nr:hypothetical protein [Pyrinomonadaceae bacterium]